MQNILEVGMSVGYSTIWCAEAISEQTGKSLQLRKIQRK